MQDPEAIRKGMDAMHRVRKPVVQEELMEPTSAPPEVPLIRVRPTSHTRKGLHRCRKSRI